MCGCWSFAVVLISERKRSLPSAAASSGCKHLDGDGTVVAEIVRQVYRRHAARAELPLDPVAVSETCRES